MEVGTEISQKIRSAIKAKLIELGAYVDDELPDYIMVMVANKKNQEQMVSDLKLFLGKNTDTFAEWLHGLLGKLQTISVDSSTKSEVKKKTDSKKEKKKGSKKSKGNDGASSAKTKTVSIEKDNAVGDKSVKSVELDQNIEAIHKPAKKNTAAHQSDSNGDRPAEVEDVRQMLVTVAPTDELAAELETTEAKIEQSQKTQTKTATSSGKDLRSHSTVHRKRSHSPESERRVQSVSAVKKHKGLTSVVANVSKGNEEEEEYDPLCPAVGSVASVVKVTSRKSSIPPKLQANRALLVKAMGEAERSIAIKRRAVVPRVTEREDSPSEVYTPKRKKSSASEASPPPYIPSRKESSTGSRTSTAQHEKRQDQSLHNRMDARQLLSARDRRDLISRSRRMELFRKMGIDRKEEPIGLRRQEARNTDSGRERGRDHKVIIPNKEVSDSNKNKSDDVRDLKITARLGPIRGLETQQSSVEDVKPKTVRSTYSKDNTLQVIINPTASPALKGSVASRLGKVVVNRRRSSDHDEAFDNGDGDDRRKVDEGGGNRERAKMFVSRHAKNLVNKQCREAVMSVSIKADQRRRQHRSVSPDSRVVEADIIDNVEYDESDEKDRSEIVVEGKRSLSLSPSRSGKVIMQQRSVDSDMKITNKEKVDSDSEQDDREPDDLAVMIGEELEPELLNDTVQDDLNLEEENEADDIETLIGVRSEEDKPKPGTRFIVTLDGVDERQFDSEAEKSKNKDTPFIQPSVVAIPKISPSSHYLPHPKLSPLSAPPGAVPIQATLSLAPLPLPVYTMGQPLPPNPIKPLPPKIQPFSINLKDSDDEVEDKESRLQSMSSGFISQISNEGHGLSALQKAKMLERCKFWPACMAGSECEFHHPTSYCKKFPNCKFMDKCLFIHPNCRFDSKCIRQDCPFTHTSRRPGLASAPVANPTPVTIPTPPPVTTVCRFFPNCHNISCPFVHPKPCRFGTTCQNSSCMFYHPPAPVLVPAKDKLKWKAQAQPQIETVVPRFQVPDPTTKFRQPVAKVSPMNSGNTNVSTSFH